MLWASEFFMHNENLKRIGNNFASYLEKESAILSIYCRSFFSSDKNCTYLVIILNDTCYIIEAPNEQTLANVGGLVEQLLSRHEKISQKNSMGFEPRTFHSNNSTLS